jgi:hypothetical protein
VDQVITRSSKYPSFAESPCPVWAREVGVVLRESYGWSKAAELCAERLLGTESLLEREQPLLLVTRRWWEEEEEVEEELPFSSLVTTDGGKLSSYTSLTSCSRREITRARRKRRQSRGFFDKVVARKQRQLDDKRDILSYSCPFPAT